MPVYGTEVSDLAAQRRLVSSNPAADRQELEALLDQLIEDRLITLEAQRVGLDDHPDARVHIRQAEIGIAGELYGIEHILPQYKLDSFTIDTFYQAHISRYTAAHAQRRVRHITAFHPERQVSRNATTFVDSLYEGWDPQRKIDTLYQRLAAGEDFAAVVRAHSDDPHTRNTGGDMGWISPQTLADGEFSQHVFSQPLNLISRPFQSRLGWHIVQVTGVRPAGPIPLDREVSTDIASQLAEMQSKQIAQRISDSLMAAGTLSFVSANIARSDDQLRPDMPLAVANGRDTIWACEYLMDRLKWIRENQGRALGPDEKRNVIRSEYYKHLCWYNMLRELGYLDRGQIRGVRANALEAERVNIVRLQLTAAGYDPTETAIQNYYRSHTDEFGRPPAPLDQVRNSIRGRLKAERHEQVRREWIRRASARHGVQRFDERLAAITLPSR
ncbi:MAG: peptidylprolyl isomerase [Candidatus Zixiibacteriota bacterium]